MCLGVEEHAALLMDTVLATANLEAVKVHVLPAERNLQDLVKPGDARIATHQKAPPDQRTDATQHGAQLQDLLPRCPSFHLRGLLCCTAHLSDLVGGRVEMAVIPINVALGLVNGGQVRALAITSATRSSQLPSTPTMAESGVPAAAINSWVGLHAPADTPPEMLKHFPVPCGRACRDRRWRCDRTERGWRRSRPCLATRDSLPDGGYPASRQFLLARG